MKKRLTERVEVMMKPEMKDELERKAYERTTSISALIRTAMEDAISHWKLVHGPGQETK